MNRILACLIFILVMMAPPTTQAAPPVCDETLFLAAQLNAMRDANPDIEPGIIHWSFVESPYQMDYWFSGGVAGFSYRVSVWRNGKRVGVAENGAWSVCAKGNGWKRYLLQHLPPELQ